MTDPRTLSQRLVSPHAFNGNGPVPIRVVEAGRDVAKLHVKHDSLTNGEIEMLFDAAALQAEWMRELYEARDALLARLQATEALLSAAEADRDVARNALSPTRNLVTPDPSITSMTNGIRTTSDVFDFDVMVSRAATALALAHDDTDQDDVPRASHYEADSYRALAAAQVPTLLARLRAAEEVCELGCRAHGHTDCQCAECVRVRARCPVCNALARWLETRASGTNTPS